MDYTSVSGFIWPVSPRNNRERVLLGFQPDTLQAIPGRDGLLFVYAIFLVPVLFSLLVGMNILVWSRSRINYVFIFGRVSSVSLVFHLCSPSHTELDVKTRLDHREYFEVCIIMTCR